MGLDLVDQAATEVFGFALTTWCRANRRNSTTSQIKKMYRKTSARDRQNFTTKLHELSNHLRPLADRVMTVGIERNIPPEGKITEGDIFLMVKKFLTSMRNYVETVRMVKSILLVDLTLKIEAMFKLHRELPKFIRQSERCVLSNLLGRTQRMIQEVFLLSFNGGRYDVPLLIPTLYQYVIRGPDKKYRCGIKVFRRGTIINSGKPILKHIVKQQISFNNV